MPADNLSPSSLSPEAGLHYYASLRLALTGPRCQEGYSPSFFQMKPELSSPEMSPTAQSNLPLFTSSRLSRALGTPFLSVTHEQQTLGFGGKHTVTVPSSFLPGPPISPSRLPAFWKLPRTSMFPLSLEHCRREQSGGTDEPLYLGSRWSSDPTSALAQLKFQ